MKKCIICGKEVDDNIIYCPHCGEFNSISGRNFEDATDDEIFEAMECWRHLKKDASVLALSHGRQRRTAQPLLRKQGII